MVAHRNLPDANRLSVVTASVLLSYAMTRLIEVPVYRMEFQAVGRDLVFGLNLNFIVTFLAAALTATGMDWLLRTHPAFRGMSVEHWLLPALTAWVIGVPLYTLQAGPLWWLAFGLGAALMALIFISEYVVVDPSDVRYTLAAAALTALSFALFLILAIAIRFSGVRLFLELPVLVISTWLVSLRTLHLRLGGIWAFGWATGIALVIMQLAAALHYLPLTPFQFGLALISPLYALTGLAINLSEETSVRRALVEPAVILFVLWVLVFLLR